MSLGALWLNPGYTVFDLCFPKKQILRQEVNLEGDFRKEINEAKGKAELIKSVSGKGSHRCSRKSQQRLQRMGSNRANAVILR